jgi:hypothetical protein
MKILDLLITFQICFVIYFLIIKKINSKFDKLKKFYVDL